MRNQEMKIAAEVITARASAGLIESGGAFWTLYPGDEFDSIDFHEWTGHMPTSEEIDYVRAKVSDLCDGQALSVNLI